MIYNSTKTNTSNDCESLQKRPSFPLHQTPKDSEAPSPSPAKKSGKRIFNFSLSNS